MQPARPVPALRRSIPPAALLLAAALAACTTDSPVRPSGDDAAAAELAFLRDGGPSAAHGGHDVELSREDRQQLTALRQATAQFHNIQKAKDFGYGELTPCWDHVSNGAMGYHYAMGSYVEDGGVVDLMEPEVLMYEPGPGGQMKLVGMEYIVLQADWTGAEPPSLLGQDFHPHSSLPIYKLHIWLWRDNPTGLFRDWNPKVSCEHADETQTFN